MNYARTAAILTLTIAMPWCASASGNARDKGKDNPHMAAPAASAQPQLTGTVVETMNSGSYTYVLIDTGKEKVWAAAPETKVETGQQVRLGPGMKMAQFESKTLKRTFEEIYFVSAIQGGDADAATLPEGHPPVGGTPAGHPNITSGASTELDFTGLQPVEGGQTVATIYADKDKLAGKQVTLRGKVAKISENILERNWLHLRDGTGEEGSNDLTVTTSVAGLKPGSTVVVSGKLVTDQDFGFGYRYPVLVEADKVEAESD